MRARGEGQGGSERRGRRARPRAGVVSPRVGRAPRAVGAGTGGHTPRVCGLRGRQPPPTCDGKRGRREKGVRTAAGGSGRASGLRDGGGAGGGGRGAGAGAGARSGGAARGGGACAAHRSSNCSRPSSSAIVASGVHSFSSTLAAPGAARYTFAREGKLAPQPSAGGRTSGAVAPTAALAGPSSKTVVPSCAPLACGLCAR